MQDMDQLYLKNVQLSRLEYQLQHLHLRSRPRCLGLVLSNRCNIGCIHCYQSKNGDNLLRPVEIGRDLRREFRAFYPYLSTLRLQGGELFAIPGFKELLDDVSLATSRPVVSISTNGTLIDDDWAERIVRMPFQNLTFSIDAGTPETFARLRKGASLEDVLANIRRIVRRKEELASNYPYLDSFFVVMRSNYREIPRYLALMKQYGVTTVSFQTVQINQENLSRFPMLASQEVVSAKEEVAEIHALLRETLRRERRHFGMIRVSGLTTLFEGQGLDTDFLREESNGLYPDSDDLATNNGFQLCPNPWTTLFVVENGDVHLCFLSEPIGNLYQAPLAEIWNSARAVAKRSHMAAGRYLASGCSKQWCSWREGKQAAPSPTAEIEAAMAELRQLAAAPMEEAAIPGELGSVRRRLISQERRISELEAMIQHSGDEIEKLLAGAQAHIDHLEAKAEQAVRDFRDLEAKRESAVARIRSKTASLWRLVRDRAAD